MKKQSKFTAEQLSEHLFGVLMMTTQEYMKLGNDKIDKQMWAFLNIGFNSALEVCGYPRETLLEVANLVTNKLKDFETENDKANQKAKEFMVAK